MTEKSWGWSTGTTNDGATTYTQTDYAEQFKVVAACNAFEGVASSYLNVLTITGASSPISINTGGAMVDGHPYKNDTSTTLVIPTPVSLTRIDRVVLRADWANHTVRITRIAGTEGGSVPAITQTSGTTYDIKLYQASITTGGVITLTDERIFSFGIAARQGAASPTDWRGTGSTNSIPVTAKIQVGAWSMSLGSTVTFPQPFSDKPLVLISGSNYAGYPAGIINITATSFDINNGGGSQSIYWIAIGPS